MADVELLSITCRVCRERASYECDVCQRTFCHDHSIDMPFKLREELLASHNTAYSPRVFCKKCFAAQEIWVPNSVDYMVPLYEEDWLNIKESISKCLAGEKANG